ncbi:putative phage-type endonuclease [Nocardioides ginsengisegetis]|uniref:Putative phage-type endonuclease n=1 Tax=Nocardioides ginsengisegetis TaxID=661491 RepID=A0A7W3PC08_9ACTN|nr:lambda exonuclease family protein [Nocardioides ginsengisegetis]MBA8805585.1 putative phage-type endonuclease [Nocardioides ginsengisegetis]MBA8806009.1 putative phage-type endonuclease [Nocardioides ginsengisegetis]
MTLHILDVEQGTPPWHDARRGIVTASTVGKLLTPTLKVASNDVSRGITATLVAERITGHTEETGMSPDMWRGVESEPIARDLYSGHYQQAVEVGFMRRDEDDWTLGYSPDGLVADDGLIEIKSPRQKTHLNTILANEVPTHYMPQLQAGLLVSGRKWIDFVSYCGGLPLWVKRVTPDPAWFDAITAACQQFEKAAAEMGAAYTQAIVGLPTTERVDFNRVELKLA